MDHYKSLNSLIFNMLCGSEHFFYGLFLAEMNKEFDKDFPGIGIYKHKDANVLTLKIGEKFWETCCKSDEERKNALIHECEHVAREHVYDASTSMYPEKKVASLAMDLSINQYLGKMPTEDAKGKRCNVRLEEMSELKLKPFESSMYYYGEMRAAKERKEQSKGKSDSKNPDSKPGNKDGTSGSGALDKILEDMEGEGSDWHEGWEDVNKGMSDQERELSKRETQDMLARLAEETEKSRGTVPAYLANAIKDRMKNDPPVVSWRTLFNRFVGSTMTTEVYQTRKRLNFRFEDAPNNRYKNKIRIVVGLDTSGSVSNEELQEFFGQVRHMWKAGVKIDVCLWDASCEDPYEYKGEQTFRRTKAGGTMASCFIDYVNKHKNKYNWSCAITLTDGYIEHNPSRSSVPMLWVLTKNGSDSFEHHARKIKLN